MAGSPGTPLTQKLGIRAGARVALVHAPDGFEYQLGALPPDVVLCRQARAPLDVVVLFVTRRSELERRFPRLARALVPAGGLWVAWPKRASCVVTDLHFEPVQRIGLDAGLVDNKVCAIDDTWSALRFVVRAADRARR
ncbi:MAG TPA: DUF3052 domain-containing protein [Acidimicrobiia bacterium]|nr:DUF3052 domain-containing protein [Acidimicrobiia bacterium]